MDNDVEAVVLACRGTLASWSPAVEAVAYEQARVNAESPLDRGAALRRRVEELSAGATPSLAEGFDRLAAERGWRRGMTGSECRSRVVALVRPYAEVPAALELAIAAGRPLVVASPGDPVLVEGALRPLDGAFDAILTARELGVAGPGAVPTAAARWMASRPAPAAVRQRLARRDRPGRDARDAPGVGQPRQRPAAPAAPPARRGVAQPARAGGVPGRGLTDASGRGLMMIEVVAFACRGTLLDWTGRHRGRGVRAGSLQRREPARPRRALCAGASRRWPDGHGLARGFERLARERRYRVGTRRRRAARGRGRDGAAAAGARARPWRSRVASRAARVVAVSRGEQPAGARPVRRRVRGRSWRTRARSTPIPRRDPLRQRARHWRARGGAQRGMRAVAPGRPGAERSPMHPAPATLVAA